MIVFHKTFEEWRDAQAWISRLRDEHPGMIDYLEVDRVDRWHWNLDDYEYDGSRGYRVTLTFYPEFT